MAMIQNYFDFSKITKVVKSENVLWEYSKLTETEPDASPMLKKYWDNIGLDKFTFANFQDGNWQSSWPWSAAYVSWIMTRADGSFPKASAHRAYAKVGFENRNNKSGGWTLFSLSREKNKIKAQVGDVLFKSRGKGKKNGTPSEKSKYGATHSDLVWKVENGVAHLAGGNLGQTNKTSIKITLNPNGSYPSNAGGYITMLKKM